MKRFTAGVVAVATALSLSTTTASAESISWEDEQEYLKVFSDPHWGSVKPLIESEDEGSIKAHDNFYESSYENDLKNNYQLGTTADILWGVGIAAAVLGTAAFAVQNGMIPGVSFPKF